MNSGTPTTSASSGTTGSPSQSTGVDPAFRSLALNRLIESGERDRLVHQLRDQLSACGWEEDLRRFCAKLVADKGPEGLTLQDLITQVTPVARRNVPDRLREESQLRVRQFLSRELGANSSSGGSQLPSKH